MKITLVNTLYYPYKVGGAEQSVKMLAETYVSMGHIVSVVCLHEGDQIVRDNINGVSVFYLPLRNKYWPFSKNSNTIIDKIIWHIRDYYNIKSSRDFEEVLDEIDPEVVHTNNLSGFSISIWSLVKRKGIKLVHTSRDYYLFHPKSTLFDDSQSINIPASNKFVRLWSRLRKYESRHVDTYVGISEFIRDFHVDNGFFKGKKSEVIYNSVDKRSNLIINPDFEQIKGVGFIGTLTENKGFFDFCKLAAKYPKIEFYVAGNFKNDNDEMLFHDKFNRENITLLGFVEFSVFLNYVNRVVLPIKWNEPFGRVVVECSINNISVYTNPIGGVKELMSLLPNVYDISSFSDTLDIKELKSGFGKSFCKFEIARQYLDVYCNA